MNRASQSVSRLLPLHSGALAAAFVAMTAATSACKSESKGESAAPSPQAPAVTARRNEAPEVPVLPPEPAPPLADKAAEVPELEAKLAVDTAYQAVWTGPRADLNLFLTFVSELLTEGGAPVDLGRMLQEKNLKDAGIKLLLVYARVGHLPADFTKNFDAHLAAVRGEPNQGLWAPYAKGAVPHDFTALAALLHRENPEYLRARIGAKAKGPTTWRVPGGGGTPPDRPYLSYEKDCYERLALLTQLAPAEQSRLDLLRQTRVGDRFVLGDFAYIISGAQARTSVGNQLVKEEASEGALFVVVSYVIENLGNAPATVVSDDFLLVDAKGRQFKPSSHANTALAMSGSRKDLLLSELNPGVKRTVKTAFEMPEAAIGAGLKLVVPEKGLMGSKKVEIAIELE
ncbi:DUF4352 domain-containing protein [Corallococcus sp. CA041A]|uniref:DUF4352 domain-containing protein n=1 Tax=Corallococcus TaxID=83461 RepID=UPI000EA35E9C|nr:DUF4352 domain-containing protein [Corallococcus sp. CA041A]RKH21917.1 DUF4352 domain-containing protein [Corallococcus sp. CA041A]